VRAFGVMLVAVLGLATAAEAVVLPPPPRLEAKAWALMDARSGQIIAAHRADSPLPPASLTKMMVLYLAFEAIEAGRLRLDERVRVSKKAWKMPGSKMFLDPRMHPTVEELLHGIATQSGNDATIALAEHIAGDEAAFVVMMNEKARELGLEKTHYRNATGLPEPGHVSTALDLVRLGAALWRDHPRFYSLFAEKEYTYAGIRQLNRNRLLWMDPRVDGIKTGHTQEAGFCLVASAEDHGMRLVAAVLGAKSDLARAQEARKLLDYGFRNFVSVRPASKQLRWQVEVFEGKQNEVVLVPASSAWLTLPRGAEKGLRFRLRVRTPLIAPLAKGERVGTIDAVIVDRGKERVLRSIPLVVGKPVERASWLGRQWDRLRLWWRRQMEHSS